jgi:hypothetical protein
VLIIASNFIFIFWPGSGASNPLPLVLLIIILFALITASAVIIFLLARRKKSSYLKNSYFEIYEKIANSIENSNLSIFEQREVLMDISDLLFQAQENNRPISSVIENDDLGSFIEKIKLSYGYRNSIAFNLLSGIQNFIFVLTIIQLAVFLMRGLDSFFETTIGLSILPGMFLLAFVVLPITRYFISRQKILWFIISIFIFIAIAFGLNMLLRNFGISFSWVQVYFEKEIPFISSWPIAVILVMVMVICWFLKWLLRHRSVQKMKLF